MLNTEFIYNELVVPNQGMNETEFKQKLEMTYSSTLSNSFKKIVEGSDLSNRHPNLTFYSFQVNPNGGELIKVSAILAGRCHQVENTILKYVKKSELENEIPQTFGRQLVLMLVNGIFQGIKLSCSVKNSDFLQQKYIKKYQDISSLDTSQKVIKECKKIAESVLEEIAAQNGVSILNHHFQIEDADLTAHRINVEEYRGKNPFIDCFKYALYILQEKQVEEWIFDPSNKKCVSFSLSDAGYRPVQFPQKDDLIVYYNDSLKATHFGVFYNAQEIHSKWGEVPQIFLHPIDVVPRSYGSKYKIFRKSD